MNFLSALIGSPVLQIRVSRRSGQGVVFRQAGTGRPEARHTAIKAELLLLKTELQNVKTAQWAAQKLRNIQSEPLKTSPQPR